MLFTDRSSCVTVVLLPSGPLLTSLRTTPRFQPPPGLHVRFEADGCFTDSIRVALTAVRLQADRLHIPVHKAHWLLEVLSGKQGMQVGAACRIGSYNLDGRYQAHYLAYRASMLGW